MGGPEKDIAEMLDRARAYTAAGQDDAAQKTYLDILRRDPAHLQVLLELGASALTNGQRDAAATVFRRVVECHPDDLTSRVTLGNMALEDGEPGAACLHYQGALARHGECAEAHQGMARALRDLGEVAAAEPHWRRGFADHAVGRRQYRGNGAGFEVLYLAAARGGNVRLRPWMDDRVFAVTVVYADFYDAAMPLPAHRLVVNAIGDADLSPDALANAEALLRASNVPVINPPAKVRETGRAVLARRCAGIEGLAVPQVAMVSRAAMRAENDFCFPLLLRSPGFHTGQHFVRVENRAEVAAAVALLPGADLFAMEYLDARGADGMARKYRVMFINGQMYPWHLAISADWKVHYYTAAMAENAVFREEERRFLENMPAVLGARAMAALGALQRLLGLDYAGVDFGLAGDGSVLLFEANATMVINAPGPEAIWDYRRNAVATAQRATRQMLLRHVQ
jgi:glutathione synthase/RimK-type ligase-like ATP-grasp enzyme